MAKPSVTTRTTKGSPLSYSELDTNFTNLRDATLTVTDGTNSTAIDLNGTIQFTAGASMTVTESNGVITLASTAGFDYTATQNIDMDGNSIVNIQSLGSTSTANISVDDDFTMTNTETGMVNSGTLLMRGSVVQLRTPTSLGATNQTWIKVIDADEKIEVNKVFQVASLSSAPGSPVAGMIYFDSSTSNFKGYNGTSWVTLG